MVAEADYTGEEIDLVDRITSMEETIDDMKSIEEDSADLVASNVMTKEQLARTRTMLKESESLTTLLTRRLNRMVAKRRGKES